MPDNGYKLKSIKTKLSVKFRDKPEHLNQIFKARYS